MGLQDRFQGVQDVVLSDLIERRVSRGSERCHHKYDLLSVLLIPQYFQTFHVLATGRITTTTIKLCWCSVYLNRLSLLTLSSQQQVSILSYTPARHLHQGLLHTQRITIIYLYFDTLRFGETGLVVSSIEVCETSESLLLEFTGS